MKKYQKLEFSMVEFEKQDVVMASSIEGQDDELVFNGGFLYEN